MRLILVDGGDFINMTLNGKHVCTSTAVYGSADQTMKMSDGRTWETISDMTYCNKEAIRIKKGDVIKFSASYDNEKHPP